MIGSSLRKATIRAAPCGRSPRSQGKNSPIVLAVSSRTSRRASSSGATRQDPEPTRLFLHVGPAGECWTGTSLFAAKHLQPDYVKSIPLPDGVSGDAVAELVERDAQLGRHIYDDGRIPAGLLERLVPER